MMNSNEKDRQIETETETDRQKERGFYLSILICYLLQKINRVITMFVVFVFYNSCMSWKVIRNG